MAPGAAAFIVSQSALRSAEERKRRRQRMLLQGAQGTCEGHCVCSFPQEQRWIGRIPSGAGFGKWDRWCKAWQSAAARLLGSLANDPAPAGQFAFVGIDVDTASTGRRNECCHSKFDPFLQRPLETFGSDEWQVDCQIDARFAASCFARLDCTVHRAAPINGFQRYGILPSLAIEQDNPIATIEP
jgi:hypothetical protein